jgi:hypothetical protein
MGANYGLTEGDATIVCGDLVMYQHAESLQMEYIKGSMQ